MSQLIDKALITVTNLLEKELSPNCLYHSLTHTMRVYKSTKEIIENSSLSEEENEVLQIAALFHDTGYIIGDKNHEEESVKIVTKFLIENNVEASIIKRITETILATKLEAKPKNELEKIIRDADSSHFAKEYFHEVSELLRQEFKANGLCNFTKNEWITENIALLKYKHTFYTDYALSLIHI